MKTVKLDNFNGLEVKVEYKPIMQKYADKTKDLIIDKSPHSDRPNRATPYKLGWVVEPMFEKTEYGLMVWNKTNWQLTHLLENGHFVTNIQSGLKWVEPRKHIYPAYLKVRNPYIKAMKKANLKVDFK